VAQVAADFFGGHGASAGRCGGPAPGTDAQAAADARWLQTMDYVVAGVVVFHWTAVLTIAIGCVVVMLMKGPGYVADDPMELSHSDKPRASVQTEEP
jgi:hypothetical protein